MNPSQEDRYSSTQDGLKSKPVLRLKKPVQDQDKKRRKQPLTLSDFNRWRFCWFGSFCDWLQGGQTPLLVTSSRMGMVMRLL